MGWMQNSLTSLRLLEGLNCNFFQLNGAQLFVSSLHISGLSENTVMTPLLSEILVLQHYWGTFSDGNSTIYYPVVESGVITQRFSVHQSLEKFQVDVWQPKRIFCLVKVECYCVFSGEAMRGDDFEILIITYRSSELCQLVAEY